MSLRFSFSILYALCILCGFLLPLPCSGFNSQDSIPRKTVAYHNELKMFREDGVWNYTTMLMREDLGLLLLGARDAIYALNIDDITDKKAAEYWPVTEDKRNECAAKGRDREVECRNYIRILHTLDDTRMYVCGTNAFNPKCGHMTYSNGKFSLEKELEEGKEKCPYNPTHSSSSLMVGNVLYSATATNFLGTEYRFSRFSTPALKTEVKHSWLNDPKFIYMDQSEGDASSDGEGDDDKVYLFFTENSVEYVFDSKIVVSRVARVCKGDMGGEMILQNRWTSFLKAPLDCSVEASSLPSLVQDVFLLKHHNWEKSVFYAVFTPQPSSSNMSAVCAYSVSDVEKVFNEGPFKKPVTLETSQERWVRDPVAVPNQHVTNRPGSCTKRSLDPKNVKSQQFIREKPILDETVRPLTGGPLVVKKGPLMTRIVVDTVLALDGERYPVMFIGTENGYIQKAVNYAGEMFIIEEIQLYEDPNPVQTLRLSSSKGQLYAGSEFGAVQMPVSDCSRYESCVDCVLARDPYCAWDSTSDLCRQVSSLSSSDTGIQSLKKGDISQCPHPEEPVVAAEDVTLVPGNNILLPCQPDSNLAQVHWHLSDQTLHSDSKYNIYNGHLVILHTSESDAGLYTCDSTEQVNNRIYKRTMAVYRLQPHTGLTVAIVLLYLLVLFLIGIVMYHIFCREYFGKLTTPTTVSGV